MLIRPQELPVGVITSFLGVPFFIYFMKRKESKRIL
jgi:ABC-type Fe3+-siderophore transport system permease subunit